MMSHRDIHRTIKHLLIEGNQSSLDKDDLFDNSFVNISE